MICDILFYFNGFEGFTIFASDDDLNKTFVLPTSSMRKIHGDLNWRGFDYAFLIYKLSSFSVFDWSFALSWFFWLMVPFVCLKKKHRMTWIRSLRMITIKLSEFYICWKFWRPELKRHQLVSSKFICNLLSFRFQSKNMLLLIVYWVCTSLYGYIL